MDKNQLAVHLFDVMAKRYQEKYMDVSAYQASLDFFCSRIHPNAHLLELACGPGNLTNYLLQQRNDLEILATDLAPNMIDLAQANNPNASFEVLDCRQIIQLDRSFSAIMAGFVLPYLSREESHQLIKDAAHLLNKEGLLYISTMEDDYEKSEWKSSNSGENIQLFQYFHEEKDLAKAMKEAGLKIIYTERIDIPNQETNYPKDLIIIGKKVDQQI